MVNNVALLQRNTVQWYELIDHEWYIIRVDTSASGMCESFAAAILGNATTR